MENIAFNLVNMLQHKAPKSYVFTYINTRIHWTPFKVNFIWSFLLLLIIIRFGAVLKLQDLQLHCIITHLVCPKTHVTVVTFKFELLTLWLWLSQTDMSEVSETLGSSQTFWPLIKSLSGCSTVIKCSSPLRFVRFEKCMFAPLWNYRTSIPSSYFSLPLRLPAVDDSGRGHHHPAVPLSVAARLCSYPAGFSPPLPGRSCSIPNGPAVEGGHWPLQTRASSGGT